VQVVQSLLAVLDRSDRVGEQNDVEGTVERIEHYRILDVTDMEFEMWMPAASFVDHRRAEVDADAAAGVQSGEDVTGAAAEVEHALVGTDEEPQKAFIFFVVEAVALDPLVPLGREAVGKLANRMLSP
jgi:hypothetical protein